MANYTVGIVGAGRIANVHLLAWLSLGVDVVAYSLDGKARELVGRHGGGTTVGSYAELLQASDAVDICTPTFTHRDLVIEAADAGKNIVCEKPLALSAVDGLDMIEACERSGVLLFPGHVVRFFPQYETMHRAVHTGRLGRVAVQRFMRAGSISPIPWFNDEKLSGGLVLDAMIHDLDFARWNAGEVRSVFATRSPAYRPGDSFETVTAQVILTHDSGTISYCTGTWAAADVEFHTRFEVAGDEGLLHHDSLASPSVSFNGTLREPVTGFLPSTDLIESPFLTEMREFYAAFRGGPVPRVSAGDGLAAVELAVAANQSIRTGEAVTIERRQ